MIYLYSRGKRVATLVVYSDVDVVIKALMDSGWVLLPSRSEKPKSYFMVPRG